MKKFNPNPIQANKPKKYSNYKITIDRQKPISKDEILNDYINNLHRNRIIIMKLLKSCISVTTKDIN